MNWVFDEFHNEWHLVDCDGGLLAIVSQAPNGYIYKGVPYSTEGTAKYEAQNDVISGKLGGDIQRRAHKQPR